MLAIDGLKSHQRPALEAIGVEKRFERRRVLRRVDLSASVGERLVLLGPNGAGKTTLLRILATLSRPSSGRAVVAGFDVVRRSESVRRQVGYVGHQPLLYGDLTALENLEYYARLYDLPQPRDQAVAGLERVDLASRASDRVRTFSRGMQQRLAIARATLHRPSVLLLDEPDTGLDEIAIESLATLLTGLDDAPSSGPRPTAVITTHDLRFGWSVGDSFAILVDGQVVFRQVKAELTLSDLQTAYRSALEQRRVAV